MRVGTVREIKDHEYRVGLTPESARELVAHGHEVWVESGAGLGIGASDRDYEAAGAQVRDAAEDVFAGCELIVKVKERQAEERAMLRAGQVLFTYLHLAPDPEQAMDLVPGEVPLTSCKNAMMHPPPRSKRARAALSKLCNDSLF